MAVNLKSLNRVLIIRLSSLGDILLTTPVIRALKNQFPKIKIDFLLKSEYQDVVKNNPYLNQIFLFSMDDYKTAINEIKNSAQSQKYDLIVDLQNNFRSWKICNQLKVNSVKFRKYSFRKFLLVHAKINLMRNLPLISNRYADTINLKLDDKGIDIFSPLKTNDKLSGLKNIIGICPGAKHFTKRYPIDYQIQLCRQLIEKNFTVVLFGGKNDKEICDEIKSNLPEIINLQNDDNLLQTLSDMKLCDVIICNDSGLMHTASSLNKKLIAIFGSTIKEFGFTPYNCSNSIVLENNNLGCRPCSHIGRNSCPKSHFKCMKEINPKYILKLIEEII
jgi:heptosyltransferase-2